MYLCVKETLKEDRTLQATHSLDFLSSPQLQELLKVNHIIVFVPSTEQFPYQSLSTRANLHLIIDSLEVVKHQ